MIFYTPALLIH